MGLPLLRFRKLRSTDEEMAKDRGRRAGTRGGTRSARLHVQDRPHPVGR